MELATPLKIFHRLVNAFKNKELKVENILDIYLKLNYWDRECLEHSTNNSCLIFCK